MKYTNICYSYRMREIILVAHNLRSTHNVGSLLRTCEGLGVKHVYLTGYTPHPHYKGDPRLPHESAKLTKQIHKTALGAELSDFWTYQEDVFTVLQALKTEKTAIAALEQTNNSIALPKLEIPEKLAIVIGREVEGIEPEILAACDFTTEIPMYGKKESFNVVQAAAMALYHCRFN